MCRSNPAQHFTVHGNEIHTQNKSHCVATFRICCCSQPRLGPRLPKGMRGSLEGRVRGVDETAGPHRARGGGGGVSLQRCVGGVRPPQPAARVAAGRQPPVPHTPMTLSAGWGRNRLSPEAQERPPSLWRTAVTGLDSGPCRPRYGGRLEGAGPGDCFPRGAEGGGGAILAFLGFWPTNPPTRSDKFSSREKSKFNERAREWRANPGTQTFLWSQTHPPIPPSPPV